MDRGALRVATVAFDLTPNEVTLLEGGVPGQALVLCAGERLFLDIVASPAEQELFDTRPAEQAERNRARRRDLSQPVLRPTAPPRAESAPSETCRAESGDPDTSWHLFDDLEPDDGAPIPLAKRRRRP